jgi:hypothetical protein
MITDPLKLFIVEYSIMQDAMHVRSLRKMVENNLYNLGNGQPSDYLPIGLFLTRERGQFLRSFSSGHRSGLRRSVGNKT